MGTHALEYALSCKGLAFADSARDIRDRLSVAIPVTECVALGDRPPGNLWHAMSSQGGRDFLSPTFITHILHNKKGIHNKGGGWA